MDPAEKLRVHFDFSKEAWEELDKLQTQLNASSPAEVVRDALGVLRWVTNHLAEGDKIMTQRKNGKAVETKFPFLEVQK